MSNRWAFVLGLALLASAYAGPAEAKYKVIYSFCSQADCTDGSDPNVGLISDAAGNLYGTTVGGGTGNVGNGTGGGTVFELVKKKHGWSEKVLYSFCSQADCADGLGPSVPLIIDVSGNLYGTTYTRGQNDFGNVFELKKGKGGSWSLQILHSFCSASGCADGDAFPGGLSYFGRQNGQPYDGTSPLYGETQNGGSGNNGGVIYRLTPKSRRGWTYDVIYSFCSQMNCPDGSGPLSTVIVDASSNIFGTTGGGGSGKAGTVFKLTPDGGSWDESVLYSFCSQTNCTDGSFPEGPLTVDGDGNLFGMTVYHGNTSENCLDNHDCGTLYEIAADGTMSTLYRFCSLANCADGAGPHGGVTIGADGTLYGVTSGGDGFSTLFSFDGSFKVLYTFCKKENCTDGDDPGNVTLISDAAGDFFGTTGGGGIGTFTGVAFEWIP